MTDEGGVAAVDRALLILDSMTEEKLTLAELSKRTGLYKSTVLRLLKSLERFGYVLRNEDGLYRLGSKVLTLGALYQRHFRTSDIIPPVLERLARELHEGASYYICEDDKRVCLHRVETTRAIKDSVHVGDRLSLTVGAAGHVLRAFNGARGEKHDEIRRQMYATSFGERDPETAAIAAPVLGPGNRLMGALSISGPRYRLEEIGVALAVPALFKYAKELTRTFGGNVDDATLLGWKEPAAATKASAPAKAKATTAATTTATTTPAKRRVAVKGA